MDWIDRLRSQRWSTRRIVLIVILLLLAPSAVSALTYEPTTLEKGTVKEPANSTTVISVQGFHFKGRDAEKKSSRLVGVGPRGDVRWVHDGSEVGQCGFTTSIFSRTGTFS